VPGFAAGAIGQEATSLIVNLESSNRPYLEHDDR